MSGKASSCGQSAHHAFWSAEGHMTPGSQHTWYQQGAVSLGMMMDSQTSAPAGVKNQSTQSSLPRACSTCCRCVCSILIII